MAVNRKLPPTSLTALSLLQREIGQLFERLSEIDRSDRAGSVEWSPSVDVYESRGRLMVVVEVPGLTPESLRVVVRDRDLVIVGERKERRPGSGIAAFHCLERPQGGFERVIPLDVAVDLAHAEASLSGGLLIVSLPRLKDRRGRETVISVEWDGDHD